VNDGFQECLILRLCFPTCLDSSLDFVRLFEEGEGRGALGPLEQKSSRGPQASQWKADTGMLAPSPLSVTP